MLFLFLNYWTAGRMFDVFHPLEQTRISVFSEQKLRLVCITGVGDGDGAAAQV